MDRAEFEARAAREGLRIPPERMAELHQAWLKLDAMARRLHGPYAYTDEPALTFDPARLPEARE